MYRDVIFARGVGYASLAAGPVFFASAGLFASVGSSTAIDVGRSAWVALLIFSPPLILIGALLAVLPCLLGAAVLSRIGQSNAGVRLPIAWALVGGLTAGGATVAVEPDGLAVAAFAATGAICALLCRWGVRWSD